MAEKNACCGAISQTGAKMTKQPVIGACYNILLLNQLNNTAFLKL